MIRTPRFFLILIALCLLLFACSKKQDTPVSNTPAAEQPEVKSMENEKSETAEVKEEEAEAEENTSREIKSYTARSWMKQNIYPEDFDLGLLAVDSGLSLKEQSAVKNSERFVRALRRSDGSAVRYIEENSSDAVLSLTESFNTKLWYFDYYQVFNQDSDIIVTARITEGRQQVLAEIRFDKNMKITLFEVFYRPEKEGLYYPGSFSGSPSFL